MSKDPPPGYRLQSEDTSYEAEQLLFERWRTMSPDEKAALAGQLSLELHESIVASVKSRVPEASPHELDIRVMAEKYDKELVKRVLGIDVPDESVRIP